MKKLHTKGPRGVYLDIFSKLGIFSASLLVAVTAACIYSPVIKSDAAETSESSKVSVSVGEVISLTLDTNALELSVATPSAEGVFTKGTITATTTTNSTGGYELYFSSEDNNTDMVHENTGVSSVIASDFSGTVTSSTMANNKWGYSLNDTDFSKIPALNAQAKIRDIDHYPTTAEKTTAVQIGTKVGSDLIAGKYKKNVVFSAIAHPTPLPPEQTMQGFDKTSLANVGDSATLQDTRDGTMYTVKKLADGNVWMTENLRLINKTISSTDSNLPSGETYTVPASDRSSFTTSDNTNSAYLDSTYGGYYNFYTATAGTGGTSLTSGNAPSSICPKGWRLPTGKSTGEFQTLYNKYNSAAFMMGEPNFTLSGGVYNGSVNDQGDVGVFWSSTVYNASLAYYLYLRSSGVNPIGFVNKYNGYSVRCVAI